MTRSTPPLDSKLEKSAQTVQRANKAGADADHNHAADAQHELQQPDHAKGRPPPGGSASNAGNDGGA